MVWGLQGQRTNMQGWKMNGIEMHDVKETKNKQRNVKKRESAELYLGTKS